MNLRAFFYVVFALTAVAQVQADKIGHDEVVPFPQPEPVTISEKAAVRFKPEIHITNGCHPYPAVSEAGMTSGGLQATGGPSSKCKGSGWGSQMYGRSTWYSGVWAIMYTWYFPKDSPSTRLGHRHDWEHVVVWIDNPDVSNPILLAVSPSAHSGYSKYVPPSADSVDGTSVKINYESHWPVNHALDTTSKSGEFQDLIMWHQMSDAARLALNTTDFGKAIMPMNDGSFLGKLAGAWPW
uniref:Necrosis inducing-like protein NPP1 type n=1 Tax=Phytophthora ramorum TaxID=164328 RepID=H3G938_PHYRM